VAELQEAREVVLRQVKPLAPPFHRHIARAKLLGRAWDKGDRVVVFEVERTVPQGRVLVTAQSLIRFIDS